MKNYRLVVSNLTPKPVIYLARFGKTPNVALDKREITGEFMETLVEYMNKDMGDVKGVQLDFTLGEQSYVLTLKAKED